MRLLFLLSLVGLASACANEQLHARDGHAKREYPQFPLSPPYRPLVWGDFNVIHTTDTHGWLLGHQKASWPEPNYSGDLGDFASFVTHMKQIAIEKDVDLLLVDSGDVHDGTGLSDGYPPGGVDGHESNKFLERLPYDLMTIGNHELYVYADTYDMYTNFVPHLNGRYLSSNANITILDSDGEVVSVPVGNRYAKFRTRKGRNVTSLGVLYDFTGHSANTSVQFVTDMVKEMWFADAIAEEPDVFVLVGCSVSYDNWPIVFNAIRAVHPYTPILIFGGHSHIRDCQQYDGRTMALESGRYMETIGWMSVDLNTSIGNTHNISFTRRYLDQNRVTYQYHTTQSNATFDTPDGRSITSGLQQLAVDFDLAYVYGTAPQDYTMDQIPYPSSAHVLTLYITQAAPVALTLDNTRAGTPNIILVNSGEIRYDIFRGAFTKNDELTVVPYPDAFAYVANVPLGVATRVLPALNSASATKRAQVDWSVHGRYRAWRAAMDKGGAGQTHPASELTPGYVTQDGCPGAGDDTLHAPLAYYPAPTYISSNPPNLTTDAPIDLVFIAFIEREVLSVINGLQNETVYTSADVSPYTPTLANAVLGLYAHTAWN